MDFLINNPLVNLSGNQFLIFYVLLIAASLLGVFLLRAKFDSTDKMPLPQIPPNPNPFELAYLRGGQYEMARSVIFALVQKGFLAQTADGKENYFSVNQAAQNWTSLSQIERNVLPWFQTTRTAAEIFKSAELDRILKPYSEQLETTFSRLNLLTSPQISSKIKIASLTIWLFLFAVGFYKILIAVSRGHFNIFFIIFLMILSLVFFLIVGKKKRLSALGESYVNQIQTAFETLKNQVKTPAGAYYQNAYAMNPYLLAVGVFGIGALSGTEFGDFEKTFHKASVSGGSGCGSSCGASSGSSCSSGGCSSGCGGGCGGCS